MVEILYKKIKKHHLRLKFFKKIRTTEPEMKFTAYKKRSMYVFWDGSGDSQQAYRTEGLRH